RRLRCTIPNLHCNMGCAPSGTKNAAVAPGKTKKTTARIDSVLSTKKGEVDKSGHTMTFEKILLKFEKLRQVLADIKAIFVSYASGASGLNFEGLKGALNILHGPMEKDEILELFEFVDLDDSKVIEFKEFLVALTV
ncbi:CML22, partial [Symbiodinium microadriaticum]